MAKNFFITNYGAKGDGITNDAPSIQAAIDACFKNGGGRVVIPHNRLFKTGSIILKSDVELYLEKNSTLKASESKADYSGFKELEDMDTELLVPAHVNCEYDGKPKQYFIYAADASNISITGKGKKRKRKNR